MVVQCNYYPIYIEHDVDTIILRYRKELLYKWNFDKINHLCYHSLGEKHVLWIE